MLLTHGGCSDATFWGSAVDELARLSRAIAYDRRGCSRTERPEPYLSTNPGEKAADGAGLLEAVDAVPAIVIGRRLGGLVALERPRRRLRTLAGLT